MEKKAKAEAKRARRVQQKLDAEAGITPEVDEFGHPIDGSDVDSQSDAPDGDPPSQISPP